MYYLKIGIKILIIIGIHAQFQDVMKFQIKEIMCMIKKLKVVNI